MLSTFWCRAAHCNPVFPVQSLFVLHRKLPNSFCIEGWHDSTVNAITTVASRKMQPTSKIKMFGKVKLKLKILFHVTCQYSGLVLPLLLGDPEPRWRHQDVGVLQLPDGPNIPWLFLPFQNWLLVIDDGDLFLWLLAKLVTRFEGSQLRFISCKIWFWSHIHQFWGKLCHYHCFLFLLFQRLSPDRPPSRTMKTSLGLKVGAPSGFGRNRAFLSHNQARIEILCVQSRSYLVLYQL